MSKCMFSFKYLPIRLAFFYGELEETFQTCRLIMSLVSEEKKIGDSARAIKFNHLRLDHGSKGYFKGSKQLNNILSIQEDMGKPQEHGCRIVATAHHSYAICDYFLCVRVSQEH